MIIHISVLGQVKLFSGCVLDSSSHRPIPYSTISNLTTNQFVLADSDGKFSIMASNGDSIMLSHIGFTTQFKTADHEEQFLYLSEKSVMLSEVRVSSKPLKFKEIKLGYNNTKFDNELDLQKNYRSAIFIKNEGIPSGLIKSIVFNIKDKGKCNEGIKVLVFLPDSNDIKKSTLLL